MDVVTIFQKKTFSKCYVENFFLFFIVGRLQNHSRYKIMVQLILTMTVIMFLGKDFLILNAFLKRFNKLVAYLLLDRSV